MQSNLDINNPNTNLSTVPPTMGLIPIDTVEAFPPALDTSAANAAHNDVAGVLRRNQACLQCRRRKLKCDAARPHCATCVRSYRHLLRTAPKTNPTLCCDYDDGHTAEDAPGQSRSRSAGHASASPEEAAAAAAGQDEEDSAAGAGEAHAAVGSGKKKRKANGEGRRRKKDDDFEEERDRLTKQIEQLQAQLATNGIPNPPSTARDDPARQGWPLASNLFHPPPPPPPSQPQLSRAVSSPTSFLDMLSAAATTNSGSDAVQGQGQGQNQMWSGRQQTGSASFASSSRRSSQPDTSPNNASTNSTGDTSSGPSILSPNEIFNFSPVAGAGSAQGGKKDDGDMDMPRGGLRGLGGSGTTPEGEEQKQAHGQGQVGGLGGGQSWPGDSNAASFMAGAAGAAINAGTGIDFAPCPDAIGVDIGSLLNMGNMTNLSDLGNLPNMSNMPNMPGLQGMGNVGINLGGMGLDGDVQMETEINMDGLGAGLDAAMQQQLLMDLFWPGWPAQLPEPNVVNDLVEAFFDLVPNLPRLLHRPRFLARMALPPTHSNFPHPALIHSICAAAAAWCSPDIYERSTRDKQWSYASTFNDNGPYGEGMKVPPVPGQGRPGKGQVTFGLRQVGFAKEAVTEGLNTGNRLFDVVRAMIILCRVFIDDTRMLECWAYGGLVARMILPLGLNVRSAELSLKSVMLPPPADALEREERRAAVWMAFYHDTIGSAASGWGTSISLEELTVPLPVSAKAFDQGETYMEPNPQDLESPDVWLKHPVVDSFVLMTKATTLLNRTNRFVRKWKNRHLRPHDDFDGMERPEFKDLANAIACFQISFPPALRDYTKLTPRRRLDIDLIAAHMLPHAATIFLYEPFADLECDPGSQPVRRLVGATQGMIGIVQQLAGVVSGEGKDFASGMHSSTSVCLVTAARTSILLMRDAMNRGDDAAAQSYRMDCEMIRLALSSFGQRFRIGHHHAQLIEYFLDRATFPTFEKLQAHYPDHPRPAAPELTPDSDFGWCVQNALNIKRGFWRTARVPVSSNSHINPTASRERERERGADSRRSSSATGPASGVPGVSPFSSGWGKGSPLGTGSTTESVGSASGSGSGAGGPGRGGQDGLVRSVSHISASIGAYESPPDASALGGGAENATGTGTGTTGGDSTGKDDSTFELCYTDNIRNSHAAATAAYHVHENAVSAEGNAAPAPIPALGKAVPVDETCPNRAASTHAIRQENERMLKSGAAIFPGYLPYGRRSAYGELKSGGGKV